MCCFVAVAETGPQAWPVVRGHASFASAPALDSRAGGLLARVSDSVEPITIETLSPPNLEPKTIPVFDQRSVAEITHDQASIEADMAIRNEFSKIVRRLNRQATEQAESRQVIARADRPSIRDVVLNRPFHQDQSESQEPSESIEEFPQDSREPLPLITPPQPRDIPNERTTDAKGLASREGTSEQDSKASAGSAASRGADDSGPPNKLGTNPDPEYPEEARAARLQGRVVLLIRVGVDGRVEWLKLARSSGVKSMDDSALKTVKDWRFEPAKRFGRPVVMEIRHAIRFEFQDE